jgi:hypothetical protein
MLVRTDASPVATVPPRFERHRQHLSGHWGHFVDPFEFTALEDFPQHMATLTSLNNTYLDILASKLRYFLDQNEL